MKKIKHTQSAVNPRPEWIAETRSRVLRHIELTSSAAPVTQRVVTLNHLWTALSFVMPQRTVYAVVRPAVIFVICFAVGTGGWITTVSASLNSLPGDALYPVKIASEHTQVAVVNALQGRTASTELRLSLARRRAEEVSKIVNTPALDSQAKSVRVQAAVEQLKSEVQSVSENLVAVQQRGGSQQEVIAVAQAITKNTEEIKQNLGDTSVHATSAEVLVAINKLQQDAGKAQEVASSTPALAITTSTPQIVLTVEIVSSTPATSTVPTAAPTSTPAQPRASTKPAHTTTSTVIIIEEDSNKNFPERPPELSPDVVDTPTPIQLEAWE